jgi:CheY-like chemotaxis protein
MKPSDCLLETGSHENTCRTRRPTVLCVDDDPDVTSAIQLILSNYDVEVIRDVYGQQGVWDAIRRKPDLIITDLAMPHRTGEELMECLKRNQETAAIPVIVLTGQRGEHVAGHVMRLGASHCLRKPVHYLDLLRAVADHIPLYELNWASVGAGGVVSSRRRED